MNLAEHDVLHASFPLEHHHELGRLLHPRASLSRGHRHVVVRELERHAPDTALPERARVLRTVQGQHERRVIAEVDAALVLLGTWRADAQAVVSADDEQLALALADELEGRVTHDLLDADDEDGRWSVFVLEDAEQLLRKETGGPAMGKLLNLADGLLGQGLRCLFLVTTNEPLGRIHPAVVRPGRCVAQVESGPLPAFEVAALLGRAVPGPMTLAEVMAAPPVRSVEEPRAVGQYL